MNAFCNAPFGAPDKSHIPTPTTNDDRHGQADKNTLVCIDYRAVLIGDKVRALTTDDVSRWDLWDWFGPEDYDDDGELITEWGTA